MPGIIRAFSVQFELRVHFTRGVFNPSNSLLQTILPDPPRVPKVLVVLDESLAAARPELAQLIENHFAGLRDQLNLVCPPFIMEGGERSKTSYVHVSEIHSQMERYHMDRHSYVWPSAAARCWMWRDWPPPRRIAACATCAFPPPC